MKADNVTLWTIDELRDQVATSLAEASYDGVPSGRVRDVPDLRTIRYYTTLGLLDRPAEMRGRTALYGRRHLLQLTAIKRLQSQGHSLSEIQSRVVGLSNTALEQTAVHGRERNFWREVPPPAPPPVVAPAPLAPGHRVVQEIALGADVTVSFPALRPVDDDDLRVIHLAAAPLMEFLRIRGLIPKSQEARDE